MHGFCTNGAGLHKLAIKVLIMICTIIDRLYDSEIKYYIPVQI